MLVAELAQRHEFRLSDAAAVPDPGPGEVQVAVRAIGICGSDVHYFAEGSIGDVACVYPMVLGHEPSGDVARVGSGVSDWAAGDRAILEPALYCYHCEFCLTGHHNVCARIRFLSSPSDPGFFREYVNLPAQNLMHLPANLSHAEGALVEPLAVILHSMEFAQIRPGESVAVFGAGPIGLLTIAVAKLSGASRIFAVEPSAHRRDMALALGADAALDPRSGDPVHEIWTTTGARGVDVAVDCAAKDDTLNQCIGVCRNAGRVVITGIASEALTPVDFHVARRKEITLFNVRRSNHNSETARDLLSAEPHRFAPMLTHSLPLTKIQSAFELVEQQADGVGKCTLTSP